MTKVTLANVGSLIDVTTAQSTINNNNAAIVTAVENTLSRDGTSPNQMGSTLDMNNNPIINLPTPVALSSPMRLADANTLNGGGTISGLPAGGTTGQVLNKTSGTDYAVAWATPTAAVANITGMGTGVSTFLATPTSANLKTAVTDETGSGPLVFSNSPTLVSPILGTPTSGTLTNCTLPVSGLSNTGAGVANFLSTPSSANLATAVTDETGTGSLVFGTSPTINNPNIVGVTNGTNASAGSVGEYVSSTLVNASSVSMTTNVTSNITSISLTAGDWDINGLVVWSFGGSTVILTELAGISTVSAGMPTVDSGQIGGFAFGAGKTGGGADYSVTPTVRLSINSTTTVYLVGKATFPTSTMAASGTISARRVR